MPFASIFLLKMFEWREREHGQDGEEAMDDPTTILALRNYGLLKFFKTQCMQKQIHLLELIVSMWDVNDQAFWVGPHILKIEIEEIYFLTGLSNRGEELVFSSHWESEFSTEDYIEEFYKASTRKVSGKITIKDVFSHYAKSYSQSQSSQFLCDRIWL